MNLYHYCSNKSFLLILRSHEVWASELSLSNDRLEGKWVREIFLQSDGIKNLPPHQHDALIRRLDAMNAFFGGSGFCLSEEDDLLSQWRGYADDAAGVSIGFDASYFEQMENQEDRKYGVTLRKVTYDVASQEKDVESYVARAVAAIREGATRSIDGSLLSPTSEAEKKEIQKANRNLSFILFSMFPLLYTMKNPAFSEEREWRLISYVSKPFGTYESFELERLDFYAKRDRIVPVRRIPLVALDASPIRRVVMGPRNITPNGVVSAALNKFGFGDVEVVSSRASYR